MQSSNTVNSLVVLLLAAAFSLDCLVTQPINMVMTAGSGGVPSAKHNWDTNSMKNVLHRLLYWLWALIPSLEEIECVIIMKCPTKMMKLLNLENDNPTIQT